MQSTTEKTSTMDEMMSMGMGSMTSVEELPQAKSPKYPVGTKVKILATHMKGMQGAEGQVVGAYDRTAYAVDVIAPSGEVFHDHKWVIADETEQGSTGSFRVGETTRLIQGHTEGMFGKYAQAIIEEVHPQPVYMVDYTSTLDGSLVKNHQWVVEDEVEPLA